MPGAPNPAASLNANRPGYATPLQLAAAWLAAGGPPDQTARAVAVAMAESRGKLNAANVNTNGTTDHGPWQINDVNLGPGGVAQAQAGNIDNLLANARAAVAVYNSQGWGGWSTFNNGTSDQFFQLGLTAENTARSSTWNQLMGALIPLLGVAAAGTLPASESAASAESGAAAGGGAGAAGAASKLATAVNAAKGALATGAFLSMLADPHLWIRVVEVIGALILLAFGLFELVGKGQSYSPLHRVTSRT